MEMNGTTKRCNSTFALRSYSFLFMSPFLHALGGGAAGRVEWTKLWEDVEMDVEMDVEGGDGRGGDVAMVAALVILAECLWV